MHVNTMHQITCLLCRAKFLDDTFPSCSHVCKIVMREDFLKELSYRMAEYSNRYTRRARGMKSDPDDINKLDPRSASGMKRIIDHLWMESILSVPIMHTSFYEPLSVPRMHTSFYKPFEHPPYDRAVNIHDILHAAAWFQTTFPTSG